MRTLTATELLMVVGATADQFSKPAECELRGMPVDETVEARPELQWEATLFALHLLDRWALSRLGFAGRELTMGGLQQLIIDRSGEEIAKAIRDGYNDMQKEYGQYPKLFPADGENLKGTLCWEVAKRMIYKFSPDQLGILALFSAISSNAALFMFSCCDEIASE